MKFKHRRSVRPDPARRRLRSSLEALESRQLLAQTPYLPISGYTIAEHLPALDRGPVPPAIITHPIGSDPNLLATYQNAGKHLSGQDRQGNRWNIDVSGPGYAIVTDTTPNDGVLDDDLATISLVGTSLTQTVVTGQVSQSYRTPSSYTQLPTLGQVRFNRLEAQDGVKSIILNGFELTDTITQTVASQILSPAEPNYNAITGVQLHGGVQLLEFEGINGVFPTSLNPSPIVVAIGNATTPIKVHPTIRIDHIYNTAFDDTAFNTAGTQVVPTGPLTSPTVTLFVNGNVAAFNVVSISQQPDFGTLKPEINGTFLLTPTQLIPTQSASLEYQFPIVGTTGRTAVQAKSIDHIRVSGGAINTTFSKSAQPFQSSLTGLDSVGTAQFGGPTDAVAIDARGDIKGLKFAKGIGNPTNNYAVATNFGTPSANNGYAAAKDANGLPLNLVGGQIVTEGNIGHVVIAPNDTFKQYPQDPVQINSGLNLTDRYLVRPGTALTTTAIVAGGSIGKVHIVGDSRNSEIKSGYNYYSGIGGAEGVTRASKIGPVHIKGDLVDSVVSASFRPKNGSYPNGTGGDGTITGLYAGQIYQTNTGTTALGNTGSGFFSRFNNGNPRPRKLGAVRNPTTVTITDGTTGPTTVTTTNPILTLPVTRKKSK